MSQAAKGNIMAMICNQYHFSAHPGPRKRNTQKASIFYQQPFGKEEGRTPKSAPLTIYLFKTGLVQPTRVTESIALQYLIGDGEVRVRRILEGISVQNRSFRVIEGCITAIFLCRQVMTIIVVIVLKRSRSGLFVISETTLVGEVRYYAIGEGVGVSRESRIEYTVVCTATAHVIEGTLVDSSNSSTGNRTGSVIKTDYIT